MAGQTASDAQDRLDVQDTLFRYGWGMDHDEWDMVEAAFAPDARAEYSDLGGHEGRDAIVHGLRGPLRELDTIYHLISDHRATIDGDRARVQAYVQTTCMRRGAPGGDVHQYGGHYDNDMARTPEGWKIQVLRYTRTWEWGNTALLAGAPTLDET